MPDRNRHARGSWRFRSSAAGSPANRSSLPPVLVRDRAAFIIYINARRKGIRQRTTSAANLYRVQLVSSLRGRALRRASPSEVAEDRSQSGIAASGHSREAKAPLIHVKTLGNHLMVPHVTHE